MGAVIDTATWNTLPQYTLKQTPVVTRHFRLEHISNLTNDWRVYQI